MLSQQCISMAELWTEGRSTSLFALCGDDCFYRLHKNMDYTKKDLEAVIRRFRRIHDRMKMRDQIREREARKFFY